MTIDQLKKITGVTSPLNVITESLNSTCEKYQINTPLRLCHFLAQVLHESGTFHYNTEIASGEAYEGRKDLGNIVNGDGRRYKGRGYIQITGRSNYKAVTQALGCDFINNPEKLAEAPWNMLSAGWYWNSRKLNDWADKDDITTITKKVNGGLNGFVNRQTWLKKCKEVLL